MPQWLGPGISAAKCSRRKAWPHALRLDKAGASTGPASARQFNDAIWRTVNLPHDWAIELPFDKGGNRDGWK